MFPFTRPRRFGKSTNLSMIDAYLNMEHAGNTWFDSLSIDTLRPDDPEKNAYPAVKLDLKGLSTDSFDSFLETFRLRMAKLYGSHPETRDQEGLSGFSLEITKAVTDLTASRGMLISSLDNLMGILESLAEAALRQIRERDYAHGLRGTTILYGMAFRGKTPAVVSEIIKR